MKKLVLNYIGEDNLGLPVYQTTTGVFLKDINCDNGVLNLCTVVGGFDGDPNISISNIKKYQGLEIVIIGRDNEPTKEEKFNYMLLGRLQSDCEYFLGYGNHFEKALWAGNVADQISKMKEIHNSFPVSKKPVWLTYEGILNYEKLMTAIKK